MCRRGPYLANLPHHVPTLGDYRETNKLKAIILPCGKRGQFVFGHRHFPISQVLGSSEVVHILEL
jgi:hypothetical protein